MKAVLLVLLFVAAAALVHCAPQEVQESGKYMYKYRKRSTNFINTATAVGYRFFLQDMYGYKYTSMQFAMNMASAEIGILLRQPI
jgi:hypothetical protein